MKAGITVAAPVATDEAAVVARRPDSALGLSKRRWRSLGLHAILSITALLFAFPVIWMVISSFKSEEEVASVPPTIFPKTWLASNYSDAVHYIDFGRYTFNTALISSLVVVGTVFSCSVAAYALACINWPGRSAVFALALSTMLLPYPVTIVPLFLIFRTLGWTSAHDWHTILPLVVPAFGGNAFFIFLLRQFFRTIPRDLLEAARVDGATYLSIFLRVILPLSRAALSVVALLAFLNTWTDFFAPLVYLNDPNWYTLSIGLQQYKSQHGVQVGLLMAASVLFVLPIVVLFFAAQKTFIHGITMSGIKG
jgi:multiple sugar transport system permease protein